MAASPTPVQRDRTAPFPPSGRAIIAFAMCGRKLGFASRLQRMIGWPQTECGPYDPFEAVDPVGVTDSDVRLRVSA
jgi:hypothetical protein